MTRAYLWQADHRNTSPTKPAQASDPVLVRGSDGFRMPDVSATNSTLCHPEASKLSTEPTQPLRSPLQGNCAKDEDEDEESDSEPSDEAKVAIAGGAVAIAVVTTVTIIATGGAAAPAASLLLIA